MNLTTKSIPLVTEMINNKKESFEMTPFNKLSLPYLSRDSSLFIDRFYANAAEADCKTFYLNYRKCNSCSMLIGIYRSLEFNRHDLL